MIPAKRLAEDFRRLGKAAPTLDQVHRPEPCLLAAHSPPCLIRIHDPGIAKHLLQMLERNLLGSGLDFAHYRRAGTESGQSQDLTPSPDFEFGPSHEIVLVGDRDSADMRTLRNALASVYLPNKVVVFRPAGEEKPSVSKLAPYTESQRAIGSKATVYVCTNYSCKLPTTDPSEMLKQLRPKE